MADYVSNLTGEQMNDALQQMNERLPEQWATGKIDGEEVTETNPRYHNNAKYYSEEAGRQAASIVGLQANAITGAAGSQASVEVTGGSGSPYRFNFTIPRGDKGNKGDTGKSAYQTAHDAGYAGTEAQFNASLGNMRNITLSNRSPLNTEGIDGDVWFVYE